MRKTRRDFLDFTESYMPTYLIYATVKGKIKFKSR